MVRVLAASSLLVALALGLSWFPAGSLPPRLVDQCGASDNRRDAASIVVVGVVLSNTLVTRPVPQHSRPEFPLQLRKLTLRVENVLKGDIGGGTVPIYFFTFAGGFDGPPPLGMSKIGSRHILWLRRDSGVLRTSCDGYDYCTTGIYSGAHPGLNVDPRKPVSYAVADVMLTRGLGKIDENRFAGAIDWTFPEPEEYLIEKFRHLALTERSVIKTAACAQLWINAHDQGIQERSRSLAAESMREAACGCIATPHGDPDCGPVAHSDPPY